MQTSLSADHQALIDLGNLGIRLSQQHKYAFSKFILTNVVQKLHAMQSPQTAYFLLVAENCKAQLNQQLQALRLQNPLVQQIENDFLLNNNSTKYADIVGAENIKEALQQVILLPNLRPDIYQGMRAPPRGILLYGPPGNGKTLLAKAIAGESQCKFLSLSASSIVSKYMGDSEKLVKALFVFARCVQPTILFIDEIDSVLRARSEGEHEATRRLKNELLVQMEGMATGEEDRVYVIGATNRVQEIDGAALRRFTRKIFIGHPEAKDRQQLLQALVSKIPGSKVSASELKKFSTALKGYSNSDIKALVKEAAMLPLKEISQQQLMMMSKQAVPAITGKHLTQAMKTVLPSVSPQEMAQYAQLQAQWKD